MDCILENRVTKITMPKQLALANGIDAIASRCALSEAMPKALRSYKNQGRLR